VVKKTSKPSSEKLKKPLNKEPQSMEDLMNTYGGGVKGLEVGDKVKAKVTLIEKDSVILDIGGKTEGLVAGKAYKLAEDFIKTLKVGDEVEGVVLVPESREGYTILSLKQAAAKVVWDKIEKAYRSKSAVEVVGKSVNQAGVLVDVYGVTGFIPTSQLGKEVSKNLQGLVGTRFEALVIDFDKDLNKVVLSEKEVSEAEEIEKTLKAIKSIKEGDVFDGEVTAVYDFGCFVKIRLPIGSGKSKDEIPVEGLVHISEISYGKVDRVDEVVEIGQKVKVKVIGKDERKLALSIKRVLEDPWIKAEEKYPKDSKVTGKVVKIADFGVFVALEPGVEGLIHRTKIPPAKRFEIGDEINLVVEEIDAKEKKLSLGLILTEKPIGYK
jgi:4-hydroxy-3-methylbut-2-enyl diphosphate reductase